MGRFDLETEEIHAEWWEDGEVVVVKERTWNDEQRLASASLGKLKVRDMGKLSDRIDDAEFDLATMNAQMMLMSIESWTFQNGDKPAKVSLKNIQLLPKKDGDFIMEAIVALNPQRDEEFPDDGPGSVQDREGPTAE